MKWQNLTNLRTPCHQMWTGLYHQGPRPCILQVCPKPQDSLSPHPMLGQNEGMRGRMWPAMHYLPLPKPHRNISLGGPYALVFIFRDGMHQGNSQEETGRLLQNGLSWLFAFLVSNLLPQCAKWGKLLTNRKYLSHKFSLVIFTHNI